MEEKQAVSSNATTDILGLALDWWERQGDAKPAIQPDIPILMRAAAGPIAEAMQHLQAGHSATLQGPHGHGHGPLAVGLMLVATSMHRTIDFTLTPELWTTTDWEGVTNAIETLVQLPLTYQTGHPEFAMIYSNLA